MSSLGRKKGGARHGTSNEHPGMNLLIPIVSIALFSIAHLLADRDRNGTRAREIVLLYSVGIIGFNGVVSFFTHTSGPILRPSRSAGRPAAHFSTRWPVPIWRSASSGSWASGAAISGCRSFWRS